MKILNKFPQTCIINYQIYAQNNVMNIYENHACIAVRWPDAVLQQTETRSL